MMMMMMMMKSYSSAAVLVAASFLLLGCGSLWRPVHARDWVGQRYVDEAEFVLVHGASGGAWNWYKTLTALQHSGFKTSAVDLTSNGIDKTSSDNVTSLAQFAQPLTDYLGNVAGKVILVGHSLGGVSISYAMEMFPHKIIKAIYVTAIMPKNNQSAVDTFPPDLFPSFLANGVFSLNYANGLNSNPTSISINRSNVIDYIAQESPLETQLLALALLGSTPYGGFALPLTLTPERYGSVRRFYVVTGRDKLLPPSYQESLFEANPVEAAFRLQKSDHCPFFSYPEELTALLLYIALL
ncbi:hypothetical protein MPTK1_4g06230 [Marchantia polymorpha subsp. ruderalis]|nr:hypothetical protein MARPO_0114s0030 [Marchantia polymorpha]BBN07759.1 hypothetical protein Mp_4g06230 [Marchantia polymorpha subsp. ruderalis]|eukprot:PTQ31213.1 hypothetical protein MARPO_0114s0030 [Marchantia polymorpha]